MKDSIVDFTGICRQDDSVFVNRIFKHYIYKTSGYHIDHFKNGSREWAEFYDSAGAKTRVTYYFPYTDGDVRVDTLFDQNGKVRFLGHYRNRGADRIREFEDGKISSFNKSRSRFGYKWDLSIDHDIAWDSTGKRTSNAFTRERSRKLGWRHWQYKGWELTLREEGKRCFHLERINDERKIICIYPWHL